MAINALIHQHEISRQDFKFPRFAFVIGIVTFLFWVGIIIVSNTIGKNETVTIGTTLTFCVLALGSLIIFAEALYVRLRLTSEGIESRCVFGKCGFMRWEDVASVTYAPFWKSFIFKSSDGRLMSVSPMLDQFHLAAEQLLKFIAIERLDAESREMLELYCQLSTERG